MIDRGAGCIKLEHGVRLNRLRVRHRTALGLTSLRDNGSASGSMRGDVQINRLLLLGEKVSGHDATGRLLPLRSSLHNQQDGSSGLCRSLVGASRPSADSREKRGRGAKRPSGATVCVTLLVVAMVTLATWLVVSRLNDLAHRTTAAVTVPTAEPAGAVAVVRFTVRLEGTVSDFEVQPFKEAVADVAGHGIVASNVSVAVSAGSVIVNTTIVAESTAIATSVHAVLVVSLVNGSAAASALGVAVEEVLLHPTLATDGVVAFSPSPPIEPSSADPPAPPPPPCSPPPAAIGDCFEENLEASNTTDMCDFVEVSQVLSSDCMQALSLDCSNSDNDCWTDRCQCVAVLAANTTFDSSCAFEVPNEGYMMTFDMLHRTCAVCVQPSADQGIGCTPSCVFDYTARIDDIHPDGIYGDPDLGSFVDEATQIVALMDSIWVPVQHYTMVAKRRNTSFAENSAWLNATFNASKVAYLREQPWGTYKNVNEYNSRGRVFLTLVPEDHNQAYLIAHEYHHVQQHVMAGLSFASTSHRMWLKEGCATSVGNGMRDWIHSESVSHTFIHHALTKAHLCNESQETYDGRVGSYECSTLLVFTLWNMTGVYPCSKMVWESYCHDGSPFASTLNATTPQDVYANVGNLTYADAAIMASKQIDMFRTT